MSTNALAYNYEENQSVLVSIIANRTSESYEQFVTVTITNVNEPPTLLSISNSTCAEENLGATIGTLSTSDPDAGSTFSYSVPVNSGYTIDGTSLKLASDRKLDFESTTVSGAYASRAVTVTVTDNDGLTTTLAVTVAPTNINETPTLLSISNNICAEETLGATIGTLSTTDPDAGSTFTYSVPVNSGYAIDGASLKLASDRKLDFESSAVSGAYASRAVTVTVTDNGGLTTTLAVTVAPTNVNETPTLLSISNSTCAEEVFGATIGTLSTIDPDAGSTFSYSVPVNSGYAIDGTSLQLASDRKLNFESTTVSGAYASRTVTVTVTDNGGLTATLAVTVAPTNVNEPATGLSSATQFLSLQETTPSTLAPTNVTDLLTLVAVDPDGSSSGFVNNVFSMGGNASTAVTERFQVVDGKIQRKANADFNFEAVGSYAIPIRIQDSGDNAIGFDATCTVTITDINEAPTGLSSATQGVSVPETTSSTPTPTSVTDLLTFVAVDPDGVSTQFAANGFSMGANASTTITNLFQVTNGKLQRKANTAFNAEQTGSYVIPILVRDNANGALAVSVTCTVTITNVNEAPTVLDISNSVCVEEVTGAPIGVLSASDPDNDSNTLLFSVSINSEYRIIIGENGSASLALATDSKLDFENDTVRAGYANRGVTVTVTDPAGLTKTITVTVAPSNINEAPTGLASAAQQASVPETTPDSLAPTTAIDVLTLTVADPDGSVEGFVNNTVSMGSNASTAINAIFQVANGKLQRKANVAFDHEVTASYTIPLRIVDTVDANLGVDTSCTVTITNVNEAPTQVLIARVTIAEEEAGATVGILSAADVDANSSFTYSVPINSGYRIVTSDNDTTALALMADHKLDFESDTVRGIYPARTVTVTARDNGNPSRTKELEITVVPSDRNEAPTGLAVLSQSVRLDETTASTPAPAVVTNLLTLTALDPDGEASGFVANGFTLGSTADATITALFQVAGDTLQRRSGATFDFEATSSYSIPIRITDSTLSGLFVDTTCTVSLNDRNEAPTALILSDSICREETLGADIGTLSATDVDLGDSFIFSVSTDSGYRIVNGNGLALADTLRLDTEVVGKRAGYADRSVTVTVTDAGGLTRILEVTVVPEDANDPLFIDAWSSRVISLADLESPVAVAPDGAWFDQDPETPLTVNGGAPPFSRYNEMKLRFKLTNDQTRSSTRDSDRVDATFHQLQFELPGGFGLVSNNTNGVIRIFRGDDVLATIVKDGGDAAILSITLAGDRNNDLLRITRAELAVVLRGIFYRCLLTSARGVADIFVESSTEYPWDNFFREWTGWRRIQVSTANRRPTYAAVFRDATLLAQRGSVGQVTQELFAITDDYPQQGARLIIVSPPRSGQLEQISGEDLPLDQQGRQFLEVAPALPGSQSLSYGLAFRPDTSSTAVSDVIIVQVLDGGVPPNSAGRRSSELVAIPVLILPGTAPGLNAVMDETTGRVATYLEQGAPAAVVPDSAVVVALNDPLGAWTLYLGPPVAPPGVFGTEIGTRYVVRTTATIRTLVTGDVECFAGSAGWQRIGSLSSSWTGIGRSLAIELVPAVTVAQATELVRALGVSRDGDRLPLARALLSVGLGFVTTGVAQPNEEQISRQQPTIGVTGVNDSPVWLTPNLVLRTTSAEELVGISEVRDPDGGAVEERDWTIGFGAVRRLRVDTERDPVDDAQIYRCTWSILPSAANAAGITFSDDTTAVRQQITVQEVGVGASGLDFISDAPYFQRLGERQFVPLRLSDGNATLNSELDLFLTFPAGTSEAQREVIITRIRPIPASGQLLLDFTNTIGGSLAAGDIINCSLVANRRGQAGGTAVQPIKLKLLPDVTRQGVAQ